MVRYPTRRVTSAGGVVCDDRHDGSRWVLLIARRNAAGDLQWTLPKGGIEEDESASEAALREVREETGHTATLDHLLGTIDYWFVWRPERVRYHKFVHYYLMWWDGLSPGPRDDEAEHVEWVPIDAAVVRLAHDNERTLVTGVRDLTPEVRDGSERTGSDHAGSDGAPSDQAGADRIRPDAARAAGVER